MPERDARLVRDVGEFAAELQTLLLQLNADVIGRNLPSDILNVTFFAFHLGSPPPAMPVPMIIRAGALWAPNEICPQPGRCQRRSAAPRRRTAIIRLRSEEHTSELQSLMRILYAV